MLKSRPRFYKIYRIYDVRIWDLPKDKDYAHTLKANAIARHDRISPLKLS
ncbi:hypothetical protein [Helicobacter jaachi]|nr:hypothetical protein [Helicobacter jaachi]